MKTRPSIRISLLAGIGLLVSLVSIGSTKVYSPASVLAQKGALMTARATGPFEVKVTPQPLSEIAQDTTLGRMSLDKQYHGDLEGIGKGEMLTAATSIPGSAAYVAVERVSGKVHGRSGTFALQHAGTLTRGAQQLSITVVPDSGTDQLTGLTGKMGIVMKDGKHSYDFEYALPETPRK